MDLSQKLSNIRQQIDSVEVDIKNNVNDNQAELLEYSKIFSKLKDYNFVDLSSQLSTKLNLVKSKVDGDYNELSSKFDELNNINAALTVLHSIEKFHKLFNDLEEEMNKKDYNKAAQTAQQLDQVTPIVNEIDSVKEVIPKVNKYKSIINKNNNKFINNVINLPIN